MKNTFPFVFVLNRLHPLFGCGSYYKKNYNSSAKYYDKQNIF